MKPISTTFRFTLALALGCFPMVRLFAAEGDATYSENLAQATALAKLGKFQAAMECIKRAGEREPQRYETSALTALILLQADMRVEGYAALTTAQAMAPLEAQDKLQAISDLYTRAARQVEEREEKEKAAREPTLEQRNAFAELMAIMQRAQAAADMPARRFAMEQFMQSSRHYVNDWPNDDEIWQLRLRAALELDWPDDGIEAVQGWLRLRNPDNADTPGPAALREEAIRRGWLKPIYNDPAYRHTGNMFADARHERTWKLAMTTAQIVEQARLGAVLAEPVGVTWVNSLRMGFVVVGGVYFSVYETRVADYYTFALSTGRSWKWEIGQQPDHPAVNMPWAEAKAFCDWLTDRERRSGHLKPGQYYRLPTDAEWSQAIGLPAETGATPAERQIYSLNNTNWKAPVGGQVLFNLGDERLAEVEPTRLTIKDYNDGYVRTAPVGSFKIGLNRLFDLQGNAGEWLMDNYAAGEAEHVWRGGCWLSPEWRAANPASRWRAANSYQSPGVGFRCVLAFDGK